MLQVSDILNAGKWRCQAVLLLFCLCTGGCTKPLKLPDIKPQQQIVLLGELTANDTVRIRAGQSIPVAAGSSMKYTPPVRLQMKLTRNPGYIEYLTSSYDDWVTLLHTLPYSCPSKIRPDQLYTLTVTHKDLPPATCQVYIPPAFSASIVDTASVWVNGINLLRVRIEIRDDGEREHFYVIEGIKEYVEIDGRFTWQGVRYKVSEHESLYDSLLRTDALPDVSWDTTRPGNYGRIYIYTDDDRTENLRLGTAQSASKRILLADKTINGQAYTTQVYLDKSLFVSPDGPKGPVIIQIKSVSEAYFTYLKGYELFEPSSAYNTLLQPVKVTGHVEGGLGVVGGVYRLQFQYLFDRWYATR